MLRDYSLWIHILFFIFSNKFLLINGNDRENLAARHPCNSINKRLEPFIKWTEKLASSQYGVPKDACGLAGSGPTCCTSEIVNSYAYKLSNDIKIVFDAELGQLRELLHQSREVLNQWKQNYVQETRQLTISSLEKLFGLKEYRSNIHHAITKLFDVAGNKESPDGEVSTSAIDLFKHLIVSMYRRFMVADSDMKFDDEFQKCLIVKAFDIEALPTQRELLYTITSGASLVNILQTLFIYLDADIQRMNDTGTLNFHPCVQRYARETLCPVCVGLSSSWSIGSNFDENSLDEPLCENDCRYLMNMCFDRELNPYVAFAALAQSYSHVVKQVQEAVLELKLFERLSKFHIYLYDMVVNATNSRQTYSQLQAACPNPNSKAYSPILSLEPITSEPRELANQWNRALRGLLDELQRSINSLNINLTHDVSLHICSNRHYAVKSDRCTRIDQHTPGNLTQWPLPEQSSEQLSSFNLNGELTKNQLEDLKRKITPVQDMIVSLRPRKKFSLMEFLPTFESYDNEFNNEENDISVDAVHNENLDNDAEEPLSNRIYKEIENAGSTDQSTTSSDAFRQNKLNRGQLMRWNRSISLIVICFVFFQWNATY